MNKIIINGKFWDSYLYSNNLMLIDCNNEISVFNWERLVNSKITKDKEDDLAYGCLFLNGDYLYESRFSRLFKDKDIEKLLISKFKKAKNIEYRYDEILSYREYDKVSLELIPTDIGVYDNTLYYINSKGLFYRKMSKQNKGYVSKRSAKIWDGRSQCLKVGPHNRIALSAQDQGLFEYNENWFGDDSYYRTDCNNIYHLIRDDSQYCDWCYSSIFSTSIHQNFYVVRYKRERSYDEYGKDRLEELHIDKEYNQEAILNEGKLNYKEKVFDKNALAIGAYDKIYFIKKNLISIIKFYQSGETIGGIFNYVKTIQLEEEVGDEVIHVEVSFFGIVIETNKKFFVIKKNGKIEDLNPNKEDVLDWRVFNRSKRYVNQIHIIFSNRLEIVSFYDDYFEDQANKLIGCKYDERYFSKHS